MMAQQNFLDSKSLTRSQKEVLRFFFKEYLDFHRLNRHKKSKKLIFRPQDTGIGDRMDVLSFAYWASVLSNRVLLVDWRDPFPLDQFLTNANSDVDMFAHPSEVEGLRVGKGLAAGAKTRFLSNDLKELDQYASALFSNTEIIVMETNKSPGHFADQYLKANMPKSFTPAQMQGLRTDYSFRRVLFHHVFRLTDAMKMKHEQFNSRVQLRPASTLLSEDMGAKRWLGLFAPNARPYIAVHARIGTGVGEFPAVRFKEIGQQLRVAAKCLASRAVRLAFFSGSPPYPIFLATDTPEFRELFAQTVANMSQNRIDMVSGNWDVIHSNKIGHPHLSKARPRSAQSEADEERKAMVGSYMDLIMLGHAEHIIALYSSFPRLALALGTAEMLAEVRNEICLKVERW